MNDQTSDYINKSRQAGYSDEQIKAMLVQAGWQTENINAAFVTNTAQVTNSLITQSVIAQTDTAKPKKTLIIVLLVVLLLAITGATVYYFMFFTKKTSSATSSTSASPTTTESDLSVIKDLPAELKPDATKTTAVNDLKYTTKTVKNKNGDRDMLEFSMPEGWIFQGYNLPKYSFPAVIYPNAEEKAKIESTNTESTSPIARSILISVSPLDSFNATYLDAQVKVSQNTPNSPPLKRLATVTFYRGKMDCMTYKDMKFYMECIVDYKDSPPGKEVTVPGYSDIPSMNLNDKSIIMISLATTPDTYDADLTVFDHIIQSAKILSVTDFYDKTQ